MKQYEILLLIETSRAYGRGLINGISRFAREQGNWSLYFEDRSLYDPLPLWLKHWKGDGIIARSATSQHSRGVRQLQVPFVELFGSIKSMEVCCDEVHIGRMAAEHFLSRGFSNFAFFAPEMPEWCRFRYKQFDHHLRLFGYSSFCFEPHRKRTGALSPSWDAADDRVLINWLAEIPKPIGLFAATDAYSLTILGACRRLGIHVPEEVAILGADNDKTICLAATPQLSSIDVNNVLTGYTAAKLLQQRIEEGKNMEKQSIFIHPAYVVTRQSTDMIAIDDEDVIQAMLLLRKNATQGITISDIVEKVGLSQSTLVRRFKKYLGHTPEQEIIKLKIERAKQYLRETNFPIHLVGKKTGFNPPEYFVRAFKRETGQTPNQFREKNQLKNETD